LTVVAFLLLSLAWPLKTPLARDFIRGDVDQSGGLDITDPVRIFGFLFLGAQPTSCQDTMDGDDNGELEITDGIYLLNFLFLGGSQPRPPFPFCGQDPTADAISCDVHAACPPRTTPPLVTILSPPNLVVVGSADLEVRGTVSDAPDPLSGIAVTVNGVQAALDLMTGQFGVTVNLREGTNGITVVAVDADGNAGSATISVMLDTQPPTVIVETPPARQPGSVEEADLVTDQTSLTVTGFLNDIGSAQVGGTAGSVSARSFRPGGEPIVGDVQAELQGQAFLVLDFPLRRGINVLEVVGVDGVGNQAAAVRRTVKVIDIAGQRIRRASGDGQVGPILGTLPEPLVVRLSDDSGQPVANRVVKFEVARNSGLLSSSPEADEYFRELFVPSDSLGQAAAYFTLGDRAGAGLNRVRATALGFEGEALFCATAVAALPATILATDGLNQTGIAGAPLPRPLVVLVVDAAGNPIPRLPVTFVVEQGGGSLSVGGSSEGSGRDTLVVETNDVGLAAAVFQLGPEVGSNDHLVLAYFEGLAGLAAAFLASAAAPRSIEDTAVVGIVLDNSDVPLERVTASILGTDRSTVTDAQGRFRIDAAPVGTVLLHVDGATTTRPGTWPTLEFQRTTIAGQDNGIGEPIRLPEIDAHNAFAVGGDEPVVVTMDGVPGMTLTVLPHSARFAGGERVGEITLSQVKLDKVPMPPPNGSLFLPPAWTLQPPGVHFDPPAPVTIPNNGLPPGRIVEIFQFDHDLGMFVSVGTGTVVPDGSVIASDPGSGVTKSGWGGGGLPPPPVTCPAKCKPCQRCVNGRCVPDPTKDGMPCDGVSNCGVCNAGVCMPTVADGTPCDDGNGCTQDDTCSGGVCTGRPDPPEVFSQLSTVVDLAQNPVKEKILFILRKLQVIQDISAKLRYGLRFQNECCPPRGNHAISGAYFVNVTVRMAGAKIRLPISPPVPLPFVFLVGSIGIDGSVEAMIKYTECTQCFEGGGTGKLAVPFELGLLLGNPDDAFFNFITISSGVSASLAVMGDCEGAKICAGVNFDGVGVKSSVTLLNLEVVLFDVRVIDPRPLGTTCFTLPLPQP
jgi:hypothetical protein